LSCSISLISTIVYISGITLNNLHQPGSFKRLGRTIILKSSSARLSKDWEEQ
jgi:hypothetical protein